MDKKIIDNLINQALSEDKAFSDITTKSLIAGNKISDAVIICKEDAVICGIDFAKKVFQKLDHSITVRSTVKDGAKVKKNTKILFIKGSTRAILSAERVALNFLTYLSGIATNTNHFVRAANNRKIQILDTRKTTPCLRAIERYAVKIGGGVNHRYDLQEMVLIKDNHREACAPKISITEAIDLCKKKSKGAIEIEVDNQKQFKEALSANPDIILLDNMSIPEMKKAVHLRNTSKHQPLLEASGGVNLKNISQIAKTGIERISIGALTHTHKSIDMSLELIKNKDN